jgi:methylmalonyl-CoA mutase C-terminal domain/subunit
MATAGQHERCEKVLICKIGLDGHEAGAKLVARILMHAGYEVVYTGRRQTVATVVATSRQEDVDLIGVSLLSGTHLHVARDLAAALHEDPYAPPILIGGTIPPDDYEQLYEYGITGVLGPGATPREIVAMVEAALGGSASSDAQS